MKALVTGATGFVGSHLAKALLREGLEVVCLARRTSRLTWLEGLAVEVRVAGLDEGSALARAVADVDYVFHAAGLTRARSAQQYLAANAEGTRGLLDAVAATSGSVRRFVYVSSQAAAGPSAEAVDETAEPRPLPGYGASKLAAERIVRDAAGRVPVTIVRPPAVYGARDRNLLPLFRTAQRWRLAPVVGSAAKRVSFVHVADLVAGIWLAGSAEIAEGQTYFLGSGTYSYREIVSALGEALGKRLWLVRVPSLLARLIGELGELKWTLTRRPQIVSRRKMRDLLQPGWVCSWAKAERELGYRPRVGLACGMRQTAEWYAREGWLKPLPERQGGAARG